MDAINLPPALAKAFMEQFGKGHQDPVPRPSLLPEAAAARLRDAFAAYARSYDLQPGMIVRQKHQARLYGDFDGDTGLRVVIEFLEEPIVWDSQGDESPPTVRIRLDMLVGFLAIGGDDKPDSFLFMLADSRRYEPVSDDDLVLMGMSSEPAP